MRKKTAALVLATAICAGCDMSPPITDTRPIDFAKVQPISLNIGRIEVQNGYTPPQGGGHAEGDFRESLGDTAKLLVEKQLQATGGSGVLRVTVQEASAVKESIASTQSPVVEAFSRQPSEIYRAKVSLKFEEVDEAAPEIVRRNAQVIGKRNKTILSNSTLAEKDEALRDLTSELMGDVSDGLETIVRNTFGGNVSPRP